MLAFRVSTVEAYVICVTIIIVVVHGHMHVAHTVLVVL